MEDAFAVSLGYSPRGNVLMGEANAPERCVNCCMRHWVTLEDAAVVSWPQGKKKPTMRLLANLGSADENHRDKVNRAR